MSDATGVEGCSSGVAVEMSQSSLTKSQRTIAHAFWLPIPVKSLKAAGLSWSIEASMSSGVRHFWQYKPWLFSSFAISL